MSKGAFKSFLKEAKKNDSYWVEKLKLDFTSELYKLMTETGVTKKELAGIIGTSPAYITKVFSGNANFTFESIVKLTRALDGQISIHLSHKDRTVHWFDKIDGTPKKKMKPIQWVSLTNLGLHKKRVTING